MHRHPWHPRVLPFLVYAVFLGLIPFARDVWQPSYILLYTIQCSLVLLILYRYRHHLPELTLRFHWLALPVGIGVAVAWVAIGLWLVKLFPSLFAGRGAEDFRNDDQLGPQLGWVMLVLRLLGMSIVVPMFEELFVRSLLLRSLSSFRRTAIGVVQALEDLPLIGEWVMNTSLASRADKHGPVFGQEFHRNPLGAVTAFGVAASTLIFMSYHDPRDWLGCIVCGVAYCLLVAWTNRPTPVDASSTRGDEFLPGANPRAISTSHVGHGLGPVIWAHGITNALLWVYTVYTNDWQFL